MVAWTEWAPAQVPSPSPITGTDTDPDTEGRVWGAVALEIVQRRQNFSPQKLAGMGGYSVWLHIRRWAGAR